jgi:hypothetical protein
LTATPADDSRPPATGVLLLFIALSFPRGRLPRPDFWPPTLAPLLSLPLAPLLLLLL